MKTLPALFDASPYVVQQLEATSTDGTKVPYFIVHRKNLKYDGSNPTLLSAYGGFQVSSTPYYSAISGKLWLSHGGVYVLANIRGGWDFGPAWHDAGLKTHRQRIYDDFAAVGQDLVTRKITSPRGWASKVVKRATHGRGNDPASRDVECDLYRCSAARHAAIEEDRGRRIVGRRVRFGFDSRATQVPGFDFPYNQLSPDVTYPEPLIFTTTKDDRVGPVHARKFAARMEEFNKPFFYQEIIEGGHSGGADLKEEASTIATEFVYLMRKLMD